MTKPKILSTKKLEPSLVQKANEQGFRIIEHEAIQIRPILAKEKWKEIASLLKAQPEYIVFTSSNAVGTLKKYLNDYVSYLPLQAKVFCLAGKTKEAVLQDKALFGTIEGTANNATALAQLMLDKGVKAVVFFCGNKRRDELPEKLKAGGVGVQEVVVYETFDTPFATVEPFDAILFFSPSAVQSFFSANQPKETTVCFAIGQTTADSLAPFTKNKIIISKETTQHALLDEAIHYFKNVVNDSD